MPRAPAFLKLTMASLCTEQDQVRAKKPETAKSKVRETGAAGIEGKREESQKQLDDAVQSMDAVQIEKAGDCQSV